MTTQELLEFIRQNVPGFVNPSITGPGEAFHYTFNASLIEEHDGFMGAPIDANLDFTQHAPESEPAKHNPGVVFAYENEKDTREEGGRKSTIIKISFNSAIRAMHGQEDDLDNFIAEQLAKIGIVENSSTPPTLLIVNTDITEWEIVQTTELDVLKEYHRKNEVHRKAKLAFDLAEHGLEKKRLEVKISTTESEIEELKKDLINWPEKDESLKSRNEMVRRLSVYTAAIKNSKTQNNISKHQGLVQNDRLYTMITSELGKFADGKVVVPSDSGNLLYHTDIENDEGVRQDEFITFLNEQTEELSQLNPVNFISLKEYNEELYKKFRAKFE